MVEVYKEMIVTMERSAPEPHSIPIIKVKQVLDHSKIVVGADHVYVESSKYRGFLYQAISPFI